MRLASRIISTSRFDFSVIKKSPEAAAAQLGAGRVPGLRPSILSVSRTTPLRAWLSTAGPSALSNSVAALIAISPYLNTRPEGPVRSSPAREGGVSGSRPRPKAALSPDQLIHFRWSVEDSALFASGRRC